MQLEPQNWRELLGNIISDPHEKQRIAQELGVRTITLTRWVTGESDPRPQNLRHLLNVVPEERELLFELIGEEFEDFTAVSTDDSSKDIPSEFYGRVFSARSMTNESLHFWSICNLILQQAIGQLDPDRLGIAITVVRCMPPSNGNKIRSLRESAGQGTPPWSGDLEQQGMFLGAESLAGYAVTTCRPAAIQNIHEDRNLLPAHQIPHELSAAAHPILYTGRIAGCLLISSTQMNYFLSPARLALIECYADLVSLAFDTDEFYDPLDIHLYMMPSHEVQKQYSHDFRHKVTQVMREQSVHHRRAEELVWQQLEEELLQLTAT
jgi:transcriptional regulator with XRE-family HTH domain